MQNKQKVWHLFWKIVWFGGQELLDLYQMIFRIVFGEHLFLTGLILVILSPLILYYGVIHRLHPDEDIGKVSPFVYTMQ